MASYVVDTQAIVKFLAGKKVINERIHQIMEMADEGENIIVIPSVVIFEIGYLHERGRIPVSLNDIGRILDAALSQELAGAFFHRGASSYRGRRKT